MLMMEIRDDVIWAKHLKEDILLHKVIVALDEAEQIRLSVDGIYGEWEKMKNGRDGRATPGIRPVGKMAVVWKRWQHRRGEKIPVKLPVETDDPLLRMADASFVEWYSAEDEEAFGELQPI